MNKDALNFVIGKSYDLINAPSASPEAKMAAQKFIDSVDSDDFQDEAKKYFAELEEDISPIDNVIDLFGSPAAVKMVGEERAKKMRDHAMEIKEKGAKYCDCAACAAVEAILSKKDEILGPDAA